MPRYWRLTLTSCVVAGCCLAGCSSNPKASVPTSAPPPQAVIPTPEPPAPPPQLDPILVLLAQADHHFAEGELQLRNGHLTEARAAFDRALDLLLTAPQGARVEPRLRESFERLVDRIGALEASALSAGDGFAEKSYEPASIDELLSVSAFDGPSPPAEPELTKQVKDDLASTAHDIPIPTHNRVLAYVQLFTGRLREWMATSLQRGAGYLPMIQNVFRAEGLPLDLAYVPIVESAFKPNALSRAQAKGVWQFMKETARENGLKQDWYIDERADPEKSTLAAAKYLGTLHRMFGGDWHLALASYNGGPGRVQRAVKRAGSADFWALSGSSKFLPRETREYVPMILAAIIIARNPAQYGFDIAPVATEAFERVTVPAATDIRRLAEWIATPVSELQALNPELRRFTTPVRAANYEVKVPVGMADVIRERLVTAPPTEISGVRWHTAKRADTLNSLARQFRVSRTELAQANQLSLNARLRAGQELVIPRAPATLVTAQNLRGSDADVARAADMKTTATEGDHSIYVVRRGDTLYAIAKRFGLSVNTLKSINNLRANYIVPGDRLSIPDRVASAR
jgi:membrane-bound lytic murein transglycosylase D